MNRPLASGIASDVLRSLRGALPRKWLQTRPLVPVLRFSGAIGSVTPLRPGITLATSATAIERAFSYKGARAVAIQINSPGGSPVQSTLIYRRIRALADEKSLPVYVFAEDVMASGGYLLALAGDEIYADASSIVGSIGVVSAGFGFHELMAKIGIDRRVHAVGERKAMLDPFQPEREEDVRHLQRIQKDVHETFVSLVRERRGRKVEAHGEALFDGSFWSGKQALDLGLIDGLSDLKSKMREKFGKDVRLKLISPERTLLRRRIPGVFGLPGERSLPEASFADDLISAIETRALWSRFGL